MVVDELVAVLGYEVRGQDKLSSFTQSIDKAAAGLVRFATLVGTAAATAMGAFGKSVISTSAQFESFQATLETIEGSSEKASASLDWISDFAKKTPFEVAELTEAFVRLRAYGMDPTQGLMESLGDASSGMGKSLMQAVEMIADASTGEFERIKEFGIKAKQEGDNVTFSWSQNGKDLSKTVKKTGTEITKFIQEQFGARFGGAMMRQSKTWKGMMSNLSDSWVDFQRRVGDAGFFEAVKNQLGRAMDFIGRLDADGTLDRWAKGLSRAFTYASDAIARLVERIRLNLGTIGKIIDENKGAWEWLKWVLGIIVLRMFPVAAFFAIAAVALDDFLGYLRGGKSALGDFIQWLAEFMGADPQGVADALAAIAAGALGLFAAAGALGVFAFALSPLTKALLAFSAAYVAAKEGFAWLNENLGAKNAEIAATKAVPNEKSKPGYVEQSGTDANGEFIYMQGNRRVDRPAPNPTAGFTDDALDYKFMLQNLEANAAKMRGGNAAAAVNSTVNDNSDKSVSVTVNQTVTQASDAPAAAAQATGNAAAGAAKSSLPPTRVTGIGSF